MSNPLAIAAVTATLRNLLTAGVTADPDLADTVVTMQPLDRARVNGNTANQVNIFLYHVLPSGAWRNMDMPGRVKPGEIAQPPLGLNLYYLITAFGRDNDTQRPFSHQLMGRAMACLNDHPLLSSDEIKTALANNDLWLQLERVRFTLQPFSVEEIAKLWTGFQTQYRLSVAYEAAVVLIESSRAVVAALPVLQRGQGDSGIQSQTNLLSPFPTLEQIVLPPNQTTAQLGDTLTLTGYKLSGNQISVQFSHPLLTTPLTVSASTATDTEITVLLRSDVQAGAPAPNDPAIWPAGAYMVSVVISNKGQIDQTSNAMPLALSPAITTKLPMKAKRAKNGVVTCSLTCSPEVRPEQRVALMVGSQEIQSSPVANQTSQLSFVITGVDPGTYFIRLRVDGVDSQLVDRTTAIPEFDASQKVTIP
ncbi:DUF4255 domain-containing protein [Acidicapsa acidisoli]|uniref:DUF4255 domain-containing protein n=1 Tax=Acidicapsa acidisoli TaxID=1615681 RepID=UPI0021E08ECA|nr:DUF4255 domain-containing protein [Acidicapsa acidisoli]